MSAASAITALARILKRASSCSCEHHASNHAEVVACIAELERLSEASALVEAKARAWDAWLARQQGAAPGESSANLEYEVARAMESLAEVARLEAEGKP